MKEDLNDSGKQNGRRPAQLAGGHKVMLFVRKLLSIEHTFPRVVDVLVTMARRSHQDLQTEFSIWLFSG